MALTKTSTTVLKRNDPEEWKVKYDVAFDASYEATPGEELDCTDHFSEIHEVRVDNDGASGYVIVPLKTKYSQGKVDLVVMEQSGAAGPLVEEAAATDLSTVLASVEVIVSGPALVV